MCIFLGEIFYDTNSYILYRQHSNNEIGAKITFYSRLKSKAKSLKILFSQHEREMEAKELLSVYNNILNSEDKKTIYMLANFRQNIKFRCKLLFLKPSLCHSIAMSKKSDNVFLKIRILIGCV